MTLIGEATNNYFGKYLISGDFNLDGKTDLAASSTGYATNAGRIYLFNGGSMISENASGADYKLSTSTGSYYCGYVMATGDINGDGTTDIIVGSNNATGRVLVYYNTGSYPTAANTADFRSPESPRVISVRRWR